ncbi:MAG TPA: phosphoribosyltransferase [Bradyrhizobium sp.]|uniref:phosphoribosyltransferase n=1 Tax=Bradyrhizobium sp. TaxID=376 RepID=UPI002D7FB3F8|nr:phosphoribosyltransferase [Bradyrhizobium sp.]HET7888691.1 phosphoribosyltransferase [Bradyrhizobium sp.]
MSLNETYTEPTTAYWQELTAGIPARFSALPPYRFGYPARLPCGRFLVLPLRRLPEGDRAVASLIANQAAHSVVAALAGHMATQARTLGAEIIVGLPTLGLAFAALVAERLGQPRYAPLGYSRKFWYDDTLCAPVSSITSPEPGKQLRLDPNLKPLIAGRRVVLVDDAISSGLTALAAVRLLQKTGAEVAGMVVAMKQTNRWEATLATLPTPLAVRAAFGCPLFQRGENGWIPLTETQPSVP